MTFDEKKTVFVNYKLISVNNIYIFMGCLPLVLKFRINVLKVYFGKYSNHYDINLKLHVFP